MNQNLNLKVTITKQDSGKVSVACEAVTIPL